MKKRIQNNPIYCSLSCENYDIKDQKCLSKVVRMLSVSGDPVKIGQECLYPGTCTRSLEEKDTPKNAELAPSYGSIKDPSKDRFDRTVNIVGNIITIGGVAAFWLGMIGYGMFKTAEKVYENPQINQFVDDVKNTLEYILTIS